MATTKLTGALIKSGSIPVSALGGGVVSSSTQVTAGLPTGIISSSAQYPGWVTASSQIDYNSIQNKLSGVISSSAQFNSLTNTSASFATTASFALNAGAGSGFPFSGSAIITGSLLVVPVGNVNGITGSVSGALTGTFPYSGLTSIPSGIVSSSAQVQPLLPANTVSSSAQVTAFLPASTISSSTQFKTLTDPFTGSFTGSHTGTFPYSGLTNIPSGIVSSSAQVSPLLPGGTVSSSAQYPGWVTASSQIDYNSITNKLSGVVSSAAQVQPLLPGGTVSSSAQYPGWVTSSAQVLLNTLTGTTFSNNSFYFPIDLRVEGNLTAQQIYTEYVSSSVIYESGSSKFGDTTDDVMSVTGSILVLGGRISGSMTGMFSASSQVDYNSITNKLSGVVSSSAQVQPLLPGGTVSSSAQYPGWVTASSQIDYNSITNKLSGVYSSSTQAVAAIAAQTIAPATVNATSILSSSVLQTGTNALIGGKLAVTGSTELTGTVTASNLTANQAVFTNASDGLVSNAITGTGNVVMSASPTLTGTITAASITANGTLLLQNIVSQSSAPSFTGLTSTGTILLAGIYSSSGQTDITATTGYATFSSSIATKNNTQDISINALNAATSSYAINATIQSQLAGVASSSAQVKAYLPGGTVSSSAQYPGWVTSSAQVVWSSVNYNAGIMSSSAQTVSNLTGQSPTFSGSQFSSIVSGSGLAYRLVVPVGTNYYAT